MMELQGDFIEIHNRIKMRIWIWIQLDAKIGYTTNKITQEMLAGCLSLEMLLKQHP